MAVKEGKWECSSCGAINLGRNTKCTECQGVRGDDVKFFLDDDTEEVSDQEILKTAKAGADWSCDYCQTDNRATDEKCRQCGAPKSEGGIDRKEKVILDKPPESTAPSGPPKAPARAPQKKGNIFVGIGIAAVVIFLVYFLFFRTTEDTLVLDNAVWERSIGLEEEVWVTKENWDDKVPRSAQILSQKTKQSGTKKIQTGTKRVKTGKKDLGNGFFEDVYKDQPVYKEEPVYDTWVRYRIREWKEYNRVYAKGDIDDPPTWPTYTLRSGARAGSRNESGTLSLSSSKDKSQKYKYSVKPDKLKDYKIGAGYAAKINTVGAVVSLE